MDKPLNWSDLGEHLVNAEKARIYFEFLRWQGKPVCPHCGGTEPYTITPKPGSSTRKGVYKCRVKGCRKQFTVTVGTIFEDSHIALHKWLQALYLMAASKKGISALQLQRMLGLKSYRSAWFMAHRLRYAMTEGALGSLLRGIVEVDETYVGGRRKGRQHKGRPGPDSNKTPVMALVERGGKVRAFPMEQVTSRTVASAIRDTVDVQQAVLMTDEANHYVKVGRRFRDHQAVKHGVGEYVRGTAHTNTVEGFFGLLKRGITGTFHHVGKGHLWRYCEEFCFRYNARTMSDAERTALLFKGGEGKRLTYRPLAESLESLVE
jgi:transposase-like protein